MSLREIIKMLLENWLNLLGTLAVIATLIAVIKYTIETKRLREVTVRQYELQLRPCLSVFWDEHKGFFHVANIGHGAAFNVEIDRVNNFSISFIHSDLFRPGECSAIYARGPFEGGQGESKNGIEFVKNEYELILRYRNAMNERYFSKIRIVSSSKTALFMGTGKDSSRNEAGGLSAPSA